MFSNLSAEELVAICRELYSKHYAPAKPVPFDSRISPDFSNPHEMGEISVELFERLGLKSKNGWNRIAKKLDAQHDSVAKEINTSIEKYKNCYEENDGNRRKIANNCLDTTRDFLHHLLRIDNETLVILIKDNSD